MSDLRVGILGAGYIARAHAAAYAATPGVRVIAVADPVRAKAVTFGGEVGAEWSGEPEALLASDLDIVSVCTPTPTHADLVVAALGSGKSVLCEKPIARTASDAGRMIAAARDARGVLMIGHVSRFEPDHARAQQIVAAGVLGEIRMMSQSITSSLPGWSEGGWLQDHEQSGGPIMDLAIHSFDYLAWVCGAQPVRVNALAADTPAGRATYALVTLRYGTGAIGLVETSWAHPVAAGFRVATELVGSRGRLWWDYDSISGGSMATTTGERVRFDPLGDRGFRAEVGAFVEAVRTGGPSPIPASEGLVALRTALAAGESLLSGEAVGLAEAEA